MLSWMHSPDGVYLATGPITNDRYRSLCLYYSCTHPQSTPRCFSSPVFWPISGRAPLLHWTWQMHSHAGNLTPCLSTFDALQRVDFPPAHGWNLHSVMMLSIALFPHGLQSFPSSPLLRVLIPPAPATPSMVNQDNTVALRAAMAPHAPTGITSVVRTLPRAYDQVAPATLIMVGHTRIAASPAGMALPVLIHTIVAVRPIPQFLLLQLPLPWLRTMPLIHHQPL